MEIFCRSRDLEIFFENKKKSCAIIVLLVDSSTRKCRISLSSAPSGKWRHQKKSKKKYVNKIKNVITFTEKIVNGANWIYDFVLDFFCFLIQTATKNKLGLGTWNQLYFL